MAALKAGATISIHKFDDRRPLDIKVVSAISVAYGATAKIYKGIAGTPGSKYEVALKVIPDMRGEGKQMAVAELIRRELAIISRFSEGKMSRILPFIGFASMQFQMVIVSKFMRNGNLLQYIRTTSHADRQRLVIQVAEGVYWLHVSNNIAHGDLKCENVLVNDEGGAVLADFGLSTLVEQDASNITTISAIRGMNTLAFAAPELVYPLDRSEAKTRPRSKTRESDVYAFGMLILQAFTGMRPWTGLPDIAIMGQLFAGTHHARPSEQATMLGLTDSWWAVCLQCWVRDPLARPTIGRVRETLEKQRRTPRILFPEIEEMSCFALTPCGNRIVCGHENGSIRIRDATSGQTVCGPLLGHTASVYHVAISHDSLQICSTSGDRTMRRWNAQSGASMGNPMRTSTEYANYASYSPDGMRIVSCGSDYTSCFFNAHTGEAYTGPLTGHSHLVWAVAFSCDGGCLASGSWDCTIRLWNGVTSMSVGTLVSHSPVLSLCFSPSGTQLVSGTAHGTVQVWNIPKRQLEHEMWGHSGWVEAVTFSPCGKYIASGSDDCTIRIWDAQAGLPLGAPLCGHTDWIRSLSFFPDGRQLISLSMDGKLRIVELFK